MRPGGAVEPTFFDNLRTLIESEWLRRIFIFFFIMAVIGAAGSLYFHFSGQSYKGPALSDVFGGREGLILNPGVSGNVPGTNLRSDPSRDANIIGKLTNGTRVRVVDNQGGWVKIKVLEWPGAQPDNAPEDGWIDGRFVRFD